MVGHSSRARIAGMRPLREKLVEFLRLGVRLLAVMETPPSNGSPDFASRTPAQQVGLQAAPPNEHASIVNASIATRWKAGQSGNPAGRSRKQREAVIGEALRKQLDKIDPRTSRTYLELLAEALVQKACRGNAAAIKEVCQRVDGKVMHTTEDRQVSLYDLLLDSLVERTE